jgi:hypothetical protein
MSWCFHWFGTVHSDRRSEHECVSAKFVPKLLAVEQKQTRLAVARDLLQCADQDANFMKTVITSDESWIYMFNLETQAQSSQWKTPGSLWPKKACHAWNKVKVMLTVFVDHEGAVRHKYAPDGQTINKEYDVKLLSQPHDVMWHKQPALWKQGD